MQTHLSEAIKDSAIGKEADAILRSCVHCGFCNATCPTYQLLGDEVDGPRGRIYLIKQMLEGEAVSDATQLHLDRCLTCRACETTCPSGVQYGQLLDIGREHINTQIKRPWRERALRRLLRLILPYPGRFAASLKAAGLFRLLLPEHFVHAMPSLAQTKNNGHDAWPAPRHPRRMIILDGCVQSVTQPAINTTVARVLDRLGISLLRSGNGSGCCGAVSQHLTAPQEAQAFMRRNIDAWWPEIEDCEAIISSASACGLMVKDYGALLKDDPDYADKAARISSLTKDIAEVIADEDLSGLENTGAAMRVAFHAPCTLQHGQKINGVVEKILCAAGYELSAVRDAHLCCGAAGTYTLLQPELSRQLHDNKLSALLEDAPQCIATANIGCLLHLQHGAGIPVKHWIELLDQGSS